MSDLSAIYTEKKKDAIEEAIAKLQNSSADKQLIGPEDSNEKMCVTEKGSSLAEKIQAKDSEYKQYPSYFKNKEEYIVFSTREA